MPFSYLSSDDSNLLAMLLNEARGRGLVRNRCEERIAAHAMLEAFDNGLTDEERLRDALLQRLRPLSGASERKQEIQHNLATTGRDCRFAVYRQGRRDADWEPAELSETGPSKAAAAASTARCRWR